jgi:hypothetical protein
LVDLGDSTTGGFSNDPWGGSNAQSNNKPVSDTDSDDFFPPLSSVKQTPATIDPWATNINNTNKLLVNNNNLINPWSSSSNTSTNTNTNSSNSPSNILNLNKDPWALSVNNNNNNNNLSSSAKIDDFDLFTSNRATNLSSPTQNTKPTNDLLSDPFGDFFGNTSTSTTSTVPTINNNNSDSFLNNSSINNSNSTNPWNSAQSTTKQINPTRMTPESFLGENSSLVNLENLIPQTTTTSNNMTSGLNQRPKSTNPFGANNNNMSNQPLSSMPTSNSSTQLNNPFLSQQQQLLMNQKGPTISQLQNQSMFPSFGQTPVLPAQTSAAGYGGLAQPLIVPPIMPLSFNNNGSTFNHAQMNNQSNLFNNTSNNNNSTANSTNANNPFLMM